MKEISILEMNYSRGKQAEENFKSGYNCCQAVVLAFKDLLEIDEKTLIKLCASFGGGLARLREVCGTITGLAMAAGLLFSDNMDKSQLYTLVQELTNQFKEENGSIVCRELLNLPGGSSEPAPEARTEKYYARRPCAAYCNISASILQRYIEKQI